MRNHHLHPAGHTAQRRQQFEIAAAFAGIESQGKNHCSRRAAHGHPQALCGGGELRDRSRLLEAADLVKVIEAADKDLLDEKRDEQVALLEERHEVIG